MGCHDVLEKHFINDWLLHVSKKIKIKLKSSTSQKIVQSSLCICIINLPTQFFAEMKNYNPGQNTVDNF